MHKAIRPSKVKVNNSLATYLNPQSAIAEQFRIIRNHIRFASGKDRVGTVVVTSPSVGEGKTVAAVNLAIGMAQRGDRVLLIDANLTRPNLNYIFKLPASRGLVDVLLSQIDLQEAIHKTDIANLSIMPCGQSTPNASDLLDTKAMSSLLEQSAEQYDMILLDCSSVIGSSDACSLANKCDGVILIVAKGRSQLQTALDAKQLLELSKATILGVVLNKY